MFSLLSMVGSAHEPSQHGGGGLAQLAGRARQFHVGKTRRFRQRGFGVGGFDEFSFARFDAFGKARQKFCNLLRRRGAKYGGGFGGGVQCLVAVRPGADGKFIRQRSRRWRDFRRGNCRWLWPRARRRR